MRLKQRLIFNPNSGHNRRRPELLVAVREFVRARALDADVAVTDGPGHATALAREAVERGCGVVIALGGDGTMNEVAQALVGTPAALGLVPCGSGNGLALHLGLPRTPHQALALAAGIEPRVACIDSGTVNQRPFFNAMGLGLDANVSRRFNHLRRRGLAAYARTTWAAWRESRPERCTITANGHPETVDALLIAVANSDQYGNHARIAPHARVDDGMLDLVVVRAVGAGGAALLVLRLFLGRIDRSAAVWRIAGSRFTIERRAPGYVHTDGESFHTSERVEVLVRPRSLRVVVPRRAAAPGDSNRGRP